MLVKVEYLSYFPSVLFNGERRQNLFIRRTDFYVSECIRDLFPRTFDVSNNPTSLRGSIKC